MSGAPEYARLASAVELAAANRRGHLDNIRRIERRAAELPSVERHLHALKEAAEFLRFLAIRQAEKRAADQNTAQTGDA